MNADGSARRTIFHQDGVMAFDTEWSPVGDDVAVSVGPYFRSSAPARILAVKADGSATRTLVDDVSNDGFATWSPDGRRIAFRRGRQLVVRSLASGSEVALTDDAHFNNFPQWSPRGDWISFTSDRNGTFQIYAIRPNGTELRQLTHGDGPDAHSAFCSDGEWIVFSSGRLGFRDEQALYDSSPQPYGELFAMRSDGSDVRQLTDNKWEDATPACRPEAAH
jgi:Tol biopolymer transport system component